MRIFKHLRLLQSIQLQLTLAILVKLFLFSTSYAASIGDVQVRHCTTGNESCGKVLVGAARIDFNAIQWVGRDSPGSLSLNTRGDEFGFTGLSNYLTSGGNQNEWKYQATNSVVISQPQPLSTFGSAPAMNHFFAPSQAGIREVSHAYVILSPSDSESVTVEGEGVYEVDETNPAILLNVDVNGKLCNEKECQEYVLQGGSVAFTITPRLNPDWQNLEGVKNIEYALIELLVQENNTKCSRNKLSFIEKGRNENRFAKDNYYHYLNGTGPDSIPSICIRDYSFLVSIGKSFHIDATNLRDTQGGNVQYDFYVRGHKDAKYAGKSWKSIQLTNSQTTNPQNTQRPVATFTANPGLGVAPLTVMLDTSGSSGTVSWEIINDKGAKTSITPQGSGNSWQVTFSETGTYTVKLTTSNNGATTTASQQVEVKASSSATQPSSSSTTSDIQVHFSAIPQENLTTGTKPIILLTAENVKAVGDTDMVWWGIPKKMLGQIAIIPSSDVIDTGPYTIGLVVTTETPENPYKYKSVPVPTTQQITIGNLNEQLDYTVWLGSGNYRAVIQFKEETQAGYWNLAITSLSSPFYKIDAKTPVWMTFQLQGNGTESTLNYESETAGLKADIVDQSNNKQTLTGPGKTKITLPRQQVHTDINSEPLYQPFGMTITSDPLEIKDINMTGWIDLTQQKDFVGFSVRQNSPQQVNLKLLFGTKLNYGAKNLELVIEQQQGDGTFKPLPLYLSPSIGTSAASAVSH